MAVGSTENLSSSLLRFPRPARSGEALRVLVGEHRRAHASVRNRTPDRGDERPPRFHQREETKRLHVQLADGGALHSAALASVCIGSSSSSRSARTSAEAFAASPARAASI